MAQEKLNKQKAENQNSILVISSHVIRGSVGARASVNILEQMGHAVWAMLTVTMPWQPDKGKSHRLVVGADDFQAWSDDIEHSPWQTELAAVLTGYFASAEQVVIAAQLIKQLKQKNPNLLYICDPIMGDERGLYVDDKIAQNIVKYLLPLCDMMTPNRSELEYIMGQKCADNQQIIAGIRKICQNIAKNCHTVLVTSAFAFLQNSTGNLLISEKQILLAEHPLVENPVNGLGDMIAAIFISQIIKGKNYETALSYASSCAFALLKESKRHHAYELMLEASHDVLMTNAALPIVMRNIKENKKIESEK